MDLHGLLELLRGRPAFAQLAADVRRGGRHRVPLTEGAKPYVVAALVEELDGPLLVVVGSAARSRQWAEALIAARPANDAQRVASAYTQAFGRPATAEEVERALQFMAKYQAALETREPEMDKRRLMAWQSFCHALLASTELRFID